MRYAAKGFTLVELIIVIIILSILGIMTSNYIGSGIDLYTGFAERDRSLNSIRFAMERLRREVGNALPNSASVENDCLTFWPIIASSVYSSSDFPISPISSSTGTISPLSDYSHETGDQAVVYLLDSGELTDSEKVQTIRAIDTDGETLSFSTDISFPSASPARRVYIIRESVSYCFDSSSKELCRQEDGDCITMAEDITGSFSVDDATLQRNALVQASYIISVDDQEMPVEQTLHISNTP